MQYGQAQAEISGKQSYCARRRQKVAVVIKGREDSVHSTKYLLYRAIGGKRRESAGPSRLLKVEMGHHQ